MIPEKKESTHTSPALADLFCTLDRFGQRPTAGYAPEELAAELIQVRHACDLLELEFAKLAGRFAYTDE